MGLKTPLYDLHLSLGARMVDFGGWDLPVAYGSQLEEHHAVRRSAGVFDVSHMGIVDLRGTGVRSFLLRLLANDVDRLKTPGKALYSCMLSPNGGVLDDLIIYFLDEEWYRVVVNAGTRVKDLAWMQQQVHADQVRFTERRDLAMLAVQGPAAREQLAALLPATAASIALALPPFCGAPLGERFVARTGYTGEDGFEYMCPAAEAPPLWRSLNARGVISCGLGARDTLRLEAGMNLYGNDMNERTHPLESGLGWTVAFEPQQRNFIGREALEAARAASVGRKLVGLVLRERAVMRAHQRVVSAAGEGEVTSGSFSPTLGVSIALARVPAATGAEASVDVRGKLFAAQVVKPPFVRAGQALIQV